MDATKFWKFSLVFCLWTSAAGAAAHAEDGLAPRGSPLESGLSQDEVLRRWGAPAEHVERETKRQQIWSYRNAEVTFQDGRVSAWSSMVASSATPVVALPHTVKRRPASHVTSHAIKDKTVTEILTELQDYGSSSPSEPGVINSPIRPTPLGMMPVRPDINALPPD